MSSTISFEVANRAVAHLGRHLYGSVPPALAELVANSYDAYARNVDINYRENDGKFGECVIVADNGIGMDVGSLESDYAKIGQQKKPVPVPPDLEPRSPMGKKGIGKLAAFSIGERYIVYTRMKDEPAWHHFELDYKELLEAEGTYEAECTEEEELPDSLSDFAGYESGCIVVIQEFRRQWRSTTEKGFMARLSRRFYLAQGKTDFSLKMNGEDIVLSKNSYYDKLRVIVYFGFSKHEIEVMFPSGEALKSIDLSSSSRVSDEEQQRIADMIDKGLRGWLGFSNHPKDLFESREMNFSNVIVYINGKIADDDFLRNYPDSTFASKYMVGEVLADYLGSTGDADDVVTSSRQGLDNDSGRVRELLDFILMVRSKAIGEWNDAYRSSGVSELPGYISNSAEYVEWTDGLEGPASAFNNGIMRCVKTLIDSKVVEGKESEDAVKALINGSVEMVELARRTELTNQIKEALDAGKFDAALEQIIVLLGKINASEAYSAWQVASGRINAVDKLQSLIGTDAVEKEFQTLLGENPWIIDASWRPVHDLDESFAAKREAFFKLRDGQEEEYKKQFVDILITKKSGAEEECVVVELKRDKVTRYSNVDEYDILKQINGYRKAIIGNDPDRNAHSDRQPSEIPAVFICPSDSGPVGTDHKIEFSQDARDMFMTANVTVLSYDELLVNCQRVLHEDRAIDAKLKSRPFFEAGDVFGNQG